MLTGRDILQFNYDLDENYIVEVENDLIQNKY